MFLPGTGPEIFCGGFLPLPGNWLGNAFRDRIAVAPVTDQARKTVEKIAQSEASACEAGSQDAKAKGLLCGSLGIPIHPTVCNDL